MRKTFGALAVAGVLTIAAPLAANAADDAYPVTPTGCSTPVPVTVVVDPGSSSQSSARVAAVGTSVSQVTASGTSCVKATATKAVTAKASSGSSLATTGMSDAVLPIGIAGGALALVGTGLLVSRRLARR